MNENINNTIKSIDDSLNMVEKQISDLKNDREKLLASKEILFKVNNICPICNGSGVTYRKSRGDDPYERSSDLRENCTRCNGNGKYSG